jgi:hypothetical protein
MSVIIIPTLYVLSETQTFQTYTVKKNHILKLAGNTQVIFRKLHECVFLTLRTLFIHKNSRLQQKHYVCKYRLVLRLKCSFIIPRC